MYPKEVVFDSMEDMQRFVENFLDVSTQETFEDLDREKLAEGIIEPTQDYGINESQ
jgi:hypothetical protein